MKRFYLPEKVSLTCLDGVESKCYRYASAEMQRLVGRLGVHVTVVHRKQTGKLFSLQLGDISPALNLAKKIRHDGFLCSVSSGGIHICAASGKGVLNGVYHMAEQFGFLFLLPGSEGEWAPDLREKPSIPCGKWLVNPRFAQRGVFFGGILHDFTDEEWFRFFAKLRFNALSHDVGNPALAEELGLRYEVGGHGLSTLLPRDMFAKEPELFRMFQPEDFGGKRMNDANLCVSNPKVRQIIQTNFAERLKKEPGAYAVHAWADDLPAGGWCLCPSCRALPPTDQAMLSMCHLAEVIETSGRSARIPVIAYHDTMMPGQQIEAPKEGFLLFAPRERCYGHALDDPSCARNRFYMDALKAWIKKFKGIDDAHTFEYYFDQILFRGLYPFLPEIILDDMKVYEKQGIETHMSLQVAGPAVVPEFNMLVFAKGQWCDSLTPAAFIAALSKSILPRSPKAWQKYFTRRANIFKSAMRMCGHNNDIFVDYRWLPETVLPFGVKMVKAYQDASMQLAAAADDLEASIQAAWPERARSLARKEARRAKFEAAELRVMTHQQSAMNEFANFMNTRSAQALGRGIELLEQTLADLELAHAKAVEAGLPEKAWYYRNINGWLRREFAKKIENYKVFANDKRKSPSK